MTDERPRVIDCALTRVLIQKHAGLSKQPICFPPKYPLLTKHFGKPLRSNFRCHAKMRSQPSEVTRRHLDAVIDGATIRDTFVAVIFQCFVRGCRRWSHIHFWSALTCQRFGSVATCRDLVKLTRRRGARPPRTKALTGQRTPQHSPSLRLLVFSPKQLHEFVAPIVKSLWFARFMLSQSISRNNWQRYRGIDITNYCIRQPVRIYFAP